MPEEISNEIELLKASAEGDAAAFEAIVKKYQSFICAITYSATGDVEKSEELAQETFVSAWRDLARLKDLGRFRAWLGTIARNIIRNSFRGQKRDMASRASLTELTRKTGITDSEPERIAITKEQQAVIRQALQQIPAKYREVLVLFYRQEQSVKEVAGQLELSEEAVKQRLSRGRKLIKEQVAAMVETTISRTGPGKAFTTAVVASIAGIAVKGTAAAAAHTSAATTAGVSAGATTLISGLAAKLITAAAAVAIGVGAVVAYKQATAPSGSENVSDVVDSTDDLKGVKNPEDSLLLAGLGNQAGTSGPTGPGNILAPESQTSGLGKAVEINENNVAESSAVQPETVPGIDQYDFVFTRLDQKEGQASTRTLVMGRVAADGFEFRDVETSPYASYRWGEPLCVTGRMLYCVNGSDLVTIDLGTSRSELLSSWSVRSECAIINPRSAWVYADNRLYGMEESGEVTTLKVLDFEKSAYRDIAVVEIGTPGLKMAISPDHKRLAYFVRDPNGYSLTVVDVESGEVTLPCEPVKLIIPLIASSLGDGPQLAWIDSENVLCLCSEISEKDPNALVGFYEQGVHKLVRMDTTTGEMEDIVVLPGNANVRFAPTMIRGNMGIGLLYQVQHGGLGYYRVDIEARKLVEDNRFAGGYGLHSGYLFHEEKELGPADRTDVKVSEDGRRCLWVREKQLFYHDEARESAVLVADNCERAKGLLWLEKEDLRVKAGPSAEPAGWTAFKDRPRVKPRPSPPDRRKRVSEYLAFTVITDKDIYLLHEPIQVTVTLINTSDVDIKVLHPVVFDTVFHRIVGLGLKHPRGSIMVDCGAGPYGRGEEEIILEAGQSVSATDALEVASVGDYQIEFRYKGCKEDGYVGDIKADPSVFRVVAIDNMEEGRQLFEAKFGRLMEKFRRELDMNPDWNGANDTVGDQIVGIPGMGSDAVPYLIEVIENEEKENARGLLYRALTSVAGSETLPFFAERLLLNGEAKQTCGWLQKMYCESPNTNTRDQALDALLAGIQHENVGVRLEVLDKLESIYDSRIKSCCEAAILDENAEIRIKAARYLAAAEWLDLGEWLDLAASNLTYARYLAAHSIIEELERTWNTTKGLVPAFTNEQFLENQHALEPYRLIIRAWQAWAVENRRFSQQFFEKNRKDWK